MNIIVTGGAGFIGSAVVRRLISSTNHRVLVIDKLTYAGNMSSLASCTGNERFQFVKEDIIKLAAMRKIFSDFKPDKIMHLAAESHVDRSIEDPMSFLETNIIGTFNLLQASLEFWSGLKSEEKRDFKFHHISTDEVYGDLLPNDAPFRETNRYEPSSPYSASKASSDHLVRSWNRTYGLPTVISNCSNNYGPFHSPDKLIPLTIDRVIRNKQIPIYGDGSQIRDWLYVEDHCDALLEVMENGVPGGTYNIGGDNECTNISIVKIICGMVDREIKHRVNQDSFASLVTFVKDRPGHDKRYAIDNSFIKKELGWSPKHDFELGLQKTVDWYLNNEKWVNETSKKVSK